MENFEFHNPTKIIFGKKTEEKIGEILKNDGIKKVLFVYGKESIKKTGLFDKVINLLNQNGIEYILHGGVKSNPVLSHTREGIQKAKENNVDAVLAVGGGSVIDEAKAIAVGAKTDKDIWIYFERGEEIKSALPVYDILTLAATGTEMNGYAVITNEETKEKLSISSIYIYPKVSILNPELTYTVPKEYVAYSAVDITAHSVEWYFTCKVCPNIQNRLVESIVKTIKETTDIILKEPTNYNARAEFMWASTLALNGITRTGVGGGYFPNHMIAHSIGALYDLPHGACLSIVIPAWTKWYLENNKPQFKRFAKEIFNLDDYTKLPQAIKEWFSSIGAPVSLSEVGIKDIDAIADNVMITAKLWNLDKIYTKEVIKEILNLAR
ncbi:iron-containing alcohol dehydrogenase [Venenivibrio stagnispumantis]|uniref:Iron-containing alcohol dehydrogenase n=1 Tax=Venenivibrio stagnispumantis TaxID=407998 RepID=A0AA45WJR7_9AQUI|nr:iron-containing alcohol dehydrogenase [Venenivibrio stagnispumantis]MCW4572919.1 iron-containing alcohol dehydrogenase [Venenivibrio stagnispumantis]SMP04551.1 hypothetical protein SAMN06264868_10320 [Venenivibrio stagnispumantis]